MAKKQNVVLSGNALRFTVITPIEQTKSLQPESASTNPFIPPSPHPAHSEDKKPSITHLLVITMELQSVLLVNRTLDKDFMKYIADMYGLTLPDALPSSLSGRNVVKTKLRTSVASEENVAGSFGSNVIKISEISVGVRYRYIVPRVRESQSQPLLLTPLEFRVGLLSMSSKSSVIDGGLLLSWPGGTEAAPSKSEKFNVVIENVKCVSSNEMVLRVLQESVRTVRVIEEVLMKMRMVRTCYRYQTSLVFYTLLGKVGIEENMRSSYHS